MKEVSSYEHRFEIKDGRRVWLSKPPVDVKRDIEYDDVRRKAWPQVITALDQFRAIFDQ
jgi:hypothetical protein